jgi:hypothetical protein
MKYADRPAKRQPLSREEYVLRSRQVRWTTCALEDCDYPPVYPCRPTPSFCNAHDLRRLRYGDPRAGGPMRIRGGTMARFLAKVEPEPMSGCWLWIGGVDKGYGAFHYGKFGYGNKVIGAHCAAYLLFVGEIPAGLHLDHLCRNTQCVNPQHLEPVTPGENVRRSTWPTSPVCRPRGHPRTPENTYVSNGRRLCAACKRERVRERRARLRDDGPVP